MNKSADCYCYNSMVSSSKQISLSQANFFFFSSYFPLPSLTKLFQIFSHLSKCPTPPTFSQKNFLNLLHQNYTFIYINLHPFFPHLLLKKTQSGPFPMLQIPTILALLGILLSLFFSQIPSIFFLSTDFTQFPFSISFNHVQISHILKILRIFLKISFPELIIEATFWIHGSSLYYFN